MTEQGMVVAFAGPLGSRKSDLSRAVAEALGWPRRSFGDYLRNLAEQSGRERNDRAFLQELGQSLVQTDPDKFVRDVLEGIDWRKTPNVILDGLRHAEVRHALILFLREQGVALKLVYVEMSDREREESERKRGVSLRQLSAYEQNLTEAQISDVIPAYADHKVHGTLPTSMAVSSIIGRLNLAPTRPSAAAG